MSKQPTFKKYVELLEGQVLLNNISYVKNGMYVVRTLKGNEKWLVFAYIHGENRQVLLSQFTNITNIKSINKVFIFNFNSLTFLKISTDSFYNLQIWVDFFEVIRLIKEPQHTDFNEIKSLTNNWMELFKKSKTQYKLH